MANLKVDLESCRHPEVALQPESGLDRGRLPPLNGIFGVQPGNVNGVGELADIEAQRTEEIVLEDLIGMYGADYSSGDDFREVDLTGIGALQKKE